VKPHVDLYSITAGEQMAETANISNF